MHCAAHPDIALHTSNIALGSTCLSASNNYDVLRECFHPCLWLMQQIVVFLWLFVLTTASINSVSIKSRKQRRRKTKQLWLKPQRMHDATYVNIELNQMPDKHFLWRPRLSCTTWFLPEFGTRNSLVQTELTSTHLIVDLESFSSKTSLWQHPLQQCRLLMQGYIVLACPKWHIARRPLQCKT